MNPLMMILGLLGLLAAASGRSGSDDGDGGAVASASLNDATDTASTADISDSDDGSGGDHSDHGDHGGGGHTGGGTMTPTSSSSFDDITVFGTHHGTSSHTHEDSLEGGRTAITTEAQVSYNGLREFLGLDPASLEEVGEWAFDEGLTNNDVPYGDDLPGVGLYYSMQGAKVGWIADDAFDPQILADIQLAARQEETDEVMQMVEAYGLDGYADFLEDEGLVDEFVNTLKMEPHYGGWMHGRVHGWLQIDGADGTPAAIAHDLNHLTVLSHDQTQPFMNDTFDWPQWPALDVPEADVADYFQSMVILGDPRGPGIEEADVSRASMSVDRMSGEEVIAALSTGERLSEERPEVEDEDILIDA